MHQRIVLFLWIITIFHNQCLNWIFHCNMFMFTHTPTHANTHTHISSKTMIERGADRIEYILRFKVIIVFILCRRHRHHRGRMSYGGGSSSNDCLRATYWNLNCCFSLRSTTRPAPGLTLGPSHYIVQYYIWNQLNIFRVFLPPNESCSVLHLTAAAVAVVGSHLSILGRSSLCFCPNNLLFFVLSRSFYLFNINGF